MARAKKSSIPICPVLNVDCLAYYKDSQGKWSCGMLINIDDILAGKEQCKRRVENERRAAREAGCNDSGLHRV